MWSESLTTSEKLQSVRNARNSLPPISNQVIGESASVSLVSAKGVKHPERKETSAYCRVWKRLIDLIASSLGLLILSPILIIIGILIKWTSNGPVLYWQYRVGRGGRLFRIAKFRSMVIDADNKGQDITSSGDCRVTPLGITLRRFKIDELPQLWNVLKGEMSIVGPRPEVPRYVARYTEEQRRVLCVRPGITDLASIQYRHEEDLLAQSDNPEELYCRVILPHKLNLNLKYIQQISLVFDASLILKTLKSLFV